MTALAHDALWYQSDPEEVGHTTITGYFTEGRKTGTSIMSLGEILEAGWESMTRSPQRWPIRNREERTPISSQVRALLYGRDGAICHVCGRGGMMTVDHIIPRSAFRPDQLHIADRSDNLVNVCWDCNSEKSNFYTCFTKRLGVTPRCGWCAAGHSYADHPDCGEDCPTWDELYGDGRTYQVYCGRCGHGATVPSLEWVL